jgi:hypothetical protein
MELPPDKPSGKSKDCAGNRHPRRDRCSQPPCNKHFRRNASGAETTPNNRQQAANAKKSCSKCSRGVQFTRESNPEVLNDHSQLGRQREFRSDAQKGGPSSSLQRPPHGFVSDAGRTRPPPVITLSFFYEPPTANRSALMPAGLAGLRTRSRGRARSSGVLAILVDAGLRDGVFSLRIGLQRSRRFHR